jgi:hypothetical protein
LVTNILVWLGTDNYLWKLIAIESDKLHPDILYLILSEKIADAPQHPSIWYHTLYFLQISLILWKSSYPPITVVPAVALTKKGYYPASIALAIAASSSSGIISPLMLLLT